MLIIDLFPTLSVDIAESWGECKCHVTMKAANTVRHSLQRQGVFSLATDGGATIAEPMVVGFQYSKLWCGGVSVRQEGNHPRVVVMWKAGGTRLYSYTSLSTLLNTFVLI